MSLTRIGSIGINTGIQFAGVTTIATLNSSSNVLSVGGTVNFNSDVSIGGSVSIGGTLTYEDVTNIDSVGLITARNGIVVGSGITLSKDGDIFATGVTTATSFVGDGSQLTGVASTENIRTNTNATFLQNINVSGTATVGGVVQSVQFKLLDNAKSIYGTGADMEIYHNATNSLISNGTGTLQIQTSSDLYQQAANAITFNTNGSNERVRISSAGKVGIGTNAPENNLTVTSSNDNAVLVKSTSTAQYHSARIHLQGGGSATDNVTALLHGNNNTGGSESYFAIESKNSSQVYIKTLMLYNHATDAWDFNSGASGTTTLRLDSSGNLLAPNDNAHLRLGAGEDLQLYHDGTSSIIKNTTGALYVQSIGDLKLRTNDSELAVDCLVNGAVHLYHDGASDSSFYTRYDGFTVRNNNAESGKDCNVDLIGRVDGNVQLHFYADNNTDNNKKFQIKAGNDEFMDFNSYYSGGWDFHMRLSKGANNASDRKVQIGKGGLRFDLTAEDYRDIDGDGHLFRRDGQAQIGVDDFLYIHDIDTGSNSNRLRHRFETNTGNYHLNGTVTPNAGMDYAEYFEWSDGNPSNEDRIGHTVSVDGLTGKIKIAEEGESVIGVISGTAGFASGAHAFSWQGRFKRDEWGRGVYEEQKDENGNLIYSDAETRAQIVKVEPVETEEYNPSLENSYVPRELRKEWDIVGLMGQIRVRKTAVIPSNWVKLKEIDSVKDLYLVR